MITNKVHNIDCMNLFNKLPDNSIDLIITDPPYGIGINKMNFVTSGAVKVGGAYRNDYSNHDTTWDEKGLTKEQFFQIQRVSKNQIIFGANNFTDILPNSRGWIVWDKRCEDKFSNDFADCELAWTSFDKPIKCFRYLWSGMLQSQMGLHKEKRYHPTQKPIALGRWILQNYAQKGDIILDPFAGSGSFLIACQQSGYEYIGCEINKDYFDIITKRMNQKTVGDFKKENLVSQNNTQGVPNGHSLNSN